MQTYLKHDQPPPRWGAVAAAEHGDESRYPTHQLNQRCRSKKENRRRGREDRLLTVQTPTNHSTPGVPGTDGATLQVTRVVWEVKMERLDLAGLYMVTALCTMRWGVMFA